MPALTPPAPQGPLQAVARGPEHPRLGAISSRTVDDRLAGAISAGARPKDPPSVEPNEDAFLLRRHADRVALLVVDGAGGFGAAQAVLDTVDAALPDLMALPDPAGVAATVWASALAARQRVPPPAGLHRRPHVAVSLALVDGDGSVWSATTGDTAVIAVDGHLLRLLTGVAPHLDHHAPLPQPQRSQLQPSTVVLGVTDGFFEALGDSWPAVVRRAAARVGGAGATAVAEDLVAAALHAGGPDHVTAIVLARG